MASFVDFQAVKNAVSFADAASKLGLELKQSGNQLRGACPACNSGDARSLVITEGKGYYCFSDGKGGDVIGFAAHILGVSVKDAAMFLGDGKVNSKVVTDTVTPTVEVPTPEPEKPFTSPAHTPREAAQPTDNRLEKVAARLLHEHAEVQALGLSPKTAEELGIGYDVRGMLKGRVLFPLYRDEVLVGFLGYAADLQPAVKLPSNLTDLPQTDSKIVRLVPKVS